MRCAPAGLSRTAAYSAGIAVQKKAVAGMMLSAVFTGICAALELMGTTGRVLEDYDPGYMASASPSPCWASRTHL